MQTWVVATIAGTVLGLVFFGFVRLRMHLGPRIRDKFGNTARQAYWLLTFALMILAANLALHTLRYFFPVGESFLLQEIWFIVLAVIISLTLISGRIRKNNSEN